MIDKDRFLAGLAVLAGAFGREVDGPVQRAYYAVLSPKMTDDEWERAVGLTLEQETFWPSPAVIAAKVKADDESRAFLVYEHVNRIVNNAGGHRFLPYATYHAEFDAPTKAAISTVGGLAEFGSVSAKRFAKAYIEALQPPKLKAPATDHRVKQLVGNVVRSMPSMPSGRDRAAGRDE